MSKNKLKMITIIPTGKKMRQKHIKNNLLNFI